MLLGKKKRGKLTEECEIRQYDAWCQTRSELRDVQFLRVSGK